MSEDPTPLDWTPQGHPRSTLYGDVYFSAEDGLAETRAVFLEGCGLPQAWAGRGRFVVGELGFGTGLNILALLDLWRRTRPPDGRLHIFSVEAHPLDAQSAARALARWPELSELAGLLIDRWPGRAHGFHRIEFPELGATLDLAVAEVGEALASWSGMADAWFLDGFSPALNPAMWREEVLDLVARRSASGARAATFTVAGAVRRGLQAAGFEVEKKPGYGRKRERLEARLSGEAAETVRPRVAVVGGGIAGASAARALRELGIAPIVFEAETPGAGGSGNPAALVTPRLDAGLGPVARLAAQAFARAVGLYDATPGAVIARGVRQLAMTPKDPGRFETIAGSGLFEPGALEATPDGLDQHAALTLAPAAVVAPWAGDVRQATVDRLMRSDTGWALLDGSGAMLAEVDAVILAAGQATERLAREAGADVALTPVRGQASWTPSTHAPPAYAWGGYIVPTHDGFLFGATHDRGEIGTEVTAADHLRNLETLAAVRPDLARELSPEGLSGRAAIRATTGDRLPLAGPAGPPGLFLLTGLGSRGFSWAPLLAEHVAASAAGAPSPLPRDLAEVTDPGRFERRAALRRRNSVAG